MLMETTTRAQAKTTVTYYSLSLQLLSVVLESTDSESHFRIGYGNVTLPASLLRGFSLVQFTYN